jgi:hypothetical protein
MLDNQCASVDVHQIGVPRIVAMNQSVLETVCDYNIAWLRQLVRTGADVWPGAISCLIKATNRQIRLTDTYQAFRNHLANQLVVGDQVMRSLMDNDMCVINRPPTLTMKSFCTHRAKEYPPDMPCCATSNTSNTSAHSLVVWNDQTNQTNQNDQDDQNDQNDQNDQHDQDDQDDQNDLPDQSVQSGAWKYPMWLHHNIGNGFVMQCVRPTRPADPETVQQVVELWQQNQAMTIQQFWDKFDHVACSDWSKMQPDGEPFGGAWDLDDLVGSTAWNLTRYQNFVCLAKMAFPRQCLLYAVDFLCCYRCESPVQVKDWLEWIRNHVKATHHLELVQHDMHELEEFARLNNVVNIQAMFDKYNI